MTTQSSRKVVLDIASRIDLLDAVQSVLASLASGIGFDEDAVHYMSVAVRESVINAIKHGNHLDPTKRVDVEFWLRPGTIEVRVRDQGTGFDPGHIPDPLAAENLLRADGRGIFFIRSFMDEVSYSFAPRGGTVVTMVKHLGSPAVPPNAVRA